MGTTLLIHIAAGGLGLLSGYVALFSSKGSGPHRRAGMVFVCAMLAMSLAGLVVAIGRNVALAINVPAALMTSYLVVTSLTTLRPPARGARWLDLGALLVALGVGLTSLAFGFEALAAGGTRKEMPAFPFFLFGVLGIVAAGGDARVLRSGALRGAPRIARHLWRMSFALFIAALSFFLGQSDELPEPLRILPLLAIPVFLPLLAIPYWLWRVRTRPGGERLLGRHREEDHHRAVGHAAPELREEGPRGAGVLHRAAEPDAHDGPGHLHGVVEIRGRGADGPGS